VLGSVDSRLHNIERNPGGFKEIVRQYMSTNGDGTGTATFNGNYTGASEIVYIQPPVGTVYRLSQVIISISDAGTGGFEPADYGYDANGIAPGWTMQAVGDGGLIKDYTLIAMTVNSYFGFTNGPSGYLNLQFPLDANTALISDFDLFDRGQLLRLDGDQNERLVITLSADYRALLYQSWFAIGYIE